jgi:dUTP pyrophosphatase
MDVKIKKLHEDAVIPKYSKPGDAGLDLTATSVEYDFITGTLSYGTGIAVEIPEGYVGLVFPRSSIRTKNLILTNHVGVIDSGYRGEITFSFLPSIDYWGVPIPDEDSTDALEDGSLLLYKDAEDEYFDNTIAIAVYAVGDRIGQLIIMPYPSINFVESDALSETERGAGGFGSTGN